MNDQIITRLICTLAVVVCANHLFANEIPSPLPSDYMHFSKACVAGNEIVFAAVGDVLVHHELQIQAWKEPTRFVSLWGNVSDLIAAADIAYANLEGRRGEGWEGRSGGEGCAASSPPCERKQRNPRLFHSLGERPHSKARAKLRV